MITVGTAKPSTISSVGVNRGGSQGGYNPQSANVSLQGSSPKLQSTYNPQQALKVTQPNLLNKVLTSGQNLVNQPVSTYDTSGIEQYLRDEAAKTRALLEKYTRQVYAPSLDYATIAAQARQEAAQSVNPFYTKRLNEFLKKQAFETDTQRQQTATDIKNLEDVLAETLTGNQISGERTAQDVATNIEGINTQADQFQTDSGTDFDIARREQARQLAAGGSTGGLGAQQIQQTEQQRDITEGRQEQKFQRERDAQQLFKTRTFEDLARSGELATKTKEKGVKQAKFDLDTFIKQQDFETGEEKTKIELDRQAELERNTSKIASSKVTQFIQDITDPAQRDAAYKAYGGLI